jgi:NADH:ubiquinone oxidoreductase subunit K
MVTSSFWKHHRAKLCFIIIIDLLHISEVLQEYISLYGGQRVPFYAEFSENNFYFPIISSKFKCYNIFGKKFLRASSSSSSINLQITSGVLLQMTSLGLLLHKNRIQIKFSYYLIIVNFLKKFPLNFFYNCSNYERIIFKFVVLSIAIARSSTILSVIRYKNILS